MLSSIAIALVAAGHISLPGGPPVGMDYLAYDPATGHLFVPAGNTGKVDVIDTATGKIKREVSGFATARRGERSMGPSSGTVGGGFVFVGNRGDSSICAIDVKTLEKKGCVKLEGSPDGLQYVAATKEVWATTPRDNSITIVDAKDAEALKVAGNFKLEGGPEGYAVDEERGLYYTNLEDKDRTLAVDVKTHKVVSNWAAGCGEKGPRGLALDEKHRHLFVACTDGLRTLDVGKDGALLGELKTGAGVDNIDWLASKRHVYVASGKTGTLSIISAAEDGKLTLAEKRDGVAGGRTVLIDKEGNAYIPDSKGGRIVVVEVKK